jgi:uncharacterized zinc-type alcohol dehydrogenase-like protein
MVTKAYGAYAADRPREPMDVERRALDPGDMQDDIAFCGPRFSDLHAVLAAIRDEIHA